MGSKHLKQLAESIDASYQTMPGLSERSEENDYMGILKESLIEFDKTTTHRGPVEDLLNFSGEGELNTHKGVKGLVDILERAYHNEDDILNENSDSDNITLPTGEGPGKDKDSGTNHDPDEKDLGDVATKTAEGQSSNSAGKATTGIDNPNAGSGGTGILPNGSQPDGHKNTIMAQNDATSASKETAMKFEATDLLQEEEAVGQKLPCVSTGENEPQSVDAMKGTAPELGDEQDETGFTDDGATARGKMKKESVFEGLDEEVSEGLEDTSLNTSEEPEEPGFGEEEEVGEESPESMVEEPAIGSEEEVGEESPESMVEEPASEEIGETPEMQAEEERTGEEEPVGEELITDDQVGSEEPSDEEIGTEEETDEEEPELSDEDENEEPVDEEGIECGSESIEEIELENELESGTQAENTEESNQVENVEESEIEPGTQTTEKKSDDNSLMSPVDELFQEEDSEAGAPEENNPDDQVVLPKPDATVGDDNADSGGEGEVGNVIPDSFNQGGAPDGQEAAAGEGDLDLSSEPEQTPESEDSKKEMTPGEEDPLEIPAAGDVSQQPEESLDEGLLDEAVENEPQINEAPITTIGTKKNPKKGDVEETPNQAGDPTGEPGSSTVTNNSVEESSNKTQTKFEQAVKARKQVEESVVERLIREMEGFSDSDDLVREGLEEVDENDSQED